MSGLYIAADLSALGAAADAFACGAAGRGSHGASPSFGDAGADTAADEFTEAAGRHNAALSDASRQAAETLHGYVITFHQVGD